MSRLVSTVPMGDKSWSRKYASELVVRESSHWGMGIVYECSCLSYRSWRNFAIALRECDSTHRIVGAIDLRPVKLTEMVLTCDRTIQLTGTEQAILVGATRLHQ
ncbi:MAG: hypothetical protein RID53_22210 [Coleofasciculus sp. B1-GNL1-01]|uniref:hypothetical protein n=1 Tax=Coleofasciculus sp. B1-GNL1-01 TaxID=3068484 RepID=UPI0032FB65A1